MVVAVATGGSVVLENPVSSYIFETKYFREYVRMLKRAGLPVACHHISQRQPDRQTQRARQRERERGESRFEGIAGFGFWALRV